MANKTAAKKIAATTILDKQKAIDTIRQAATRVKTRVNDAKRNLKNTESWLAEHPSDHLRGILAKDKAELAAAHEALVKAQAELAAAEAALPPVKQSPHSNILKWFSGASLKKAQDALELLDASLEFGSWIPGASRKVWAALGKVNVARKTIKTQRDWRNPSAGALDSAVNYGSISKLANVTLQAATKEYDDAALSFYIDFRPVVDIMLKLDATRPVPTFTKLNASPTVSAELERQGAVSVEVAPIKFEDREGVDEKGRKYYYRVAIVLWPEGTKHHTSRYAYGTNHNSQCHACGHAIRNDFNWVPLVLIAKDGTKKSLWVGRDCSETLFGVKLTGDLELAEGQRL